MIQVQPPSPSSVLHQVALSPPAAAASDLKFRGPHISIDISDDFASRSIWRPALVIGLLVFPIAIAQVVLASGIKKMEIRVQVGILFFGGKGYDAIAGNPAIGWLALGVAAFFIALSVLDKKNSRGDWVKIVKRLATIYSSISLVVMTIWSFVERAVYLELSSYESCVVDIGADNVQRTECSCSSGESDDVKVDIASDADMSCGTIPDYAHQVLASYVLMVILLVLTFAGMWMWCKPSISKPPPIKAIFLEANPTPYVVSPTRSN